MKAHVEILKKVSLTLDRTKQLDDELLPTKRHEFRGINGCLQAQARDVHKANEVIDEINQHEDFTLTLLVLDLTSYGLIAVCDASLGGVDQDSKNDEGPLTSKSRIFIGEKPLVSLCARGKFNVLECDSCTITRVCREYGRRTMQFYGDLLSEILGEGAPSSKNLHLKQNAIEWSKMIVTDAPDVHDKVSTEKSGFPQQAALTLEIANIREWLVNSGAQIRWIADENMIMNGLTKYHRESRQHLARVLQERERSVQRDATLIR